MIRDNQPLMKSQPEQSMQLMQDRNLHSAVQQSTMALWLYISMPRVNLQIVSEFNQVHTGLCMRWMQTITDMFTMVACQKAPGVTHSRTCMRKGRKSSW